MGADPCPDSILRQSVFFHHATEHAVLRHHHGHGSGYRCESSTYQRDLLHIKRSHEPALLASYANQASHLCKGTDLHPYNQPCHVHRCGSHHPAVSRLLAYGGCLRTCHHHHYADDHIAAWRLPAHKGCIAIHHDTVYWRILYHRGGISCSQSVKVSRRRMVYDAYWQYIVPDDVCVGSCHKDTPPVHQRQTVGRLLSDHLRHQSRWEHP